MLRTWFGTALAATLASCLLVAPSAAAGPFAEAQRLTVLKGGAGPNQSSIAWADFDQDGNADVAIADTMANGVLVLPGRGDGTFDRGTRVRSGVQPYSVGAADFTGDGVVDIVVTGLTSHDLRVLAGRGDGTFAQAYRLGTSGFPDDMAVADLNADGHADVVSLSAVGGGKVDVYLGGPSGLKRQRAVATGGSPVGLALGVTVADLNADGHQDIAVAEWAYGPFSSAVRVLEGRGDGTFERGPSRAFAGVAEAVRAGDMNCDGVPDLVVPVAEGGIVVVRGSRTTTLEHARRAAGLPGTNAVELADLDLDGKLDLLISFFTGTAGVVSDVCSRAQLWPTSYVQTAFQSEAFGLPDLDGDGDPDLVEAGWFSREIAVALNRSAPATERP